MSEKKIGAAIIGPGNIERNHPMPHCPNNTAITFFEQKMANYWRNRFIALAADIANQGGARVAPRHLIECEENALNHLVYWEERLNPSHHPGRRFDLGAEMAKYEPKRPPC